MSIEDQEILQEFVVESSEHLADIESQLLSIEAAGENLDVDLVNTVFRGVHSIKGAAGFLGLSSINKLAHSLENVLNLMRERQLIPTTAIIEVMLKAADQLSGMVKNIEASNTVDVHELCVRLEAISEGSPPEPEPVPAPIASVSAPVAPPVAAQPLVAQPVVAQPVVAQPVVAQPVMREPIALVETKPNLLPTPPVQPAPVLAPPAPVEPLNSVAKAVSAEPAETPVNSKAQSDPNIRVAVEVLDKLMNLAGELVLGRNQLLQTIANFDRQSLESVAARINQVTSEMQDAIMQTRMQPIGNVFSRFTRVVRDLSSKLGKQCQLVIDGKDVDVDKTIIEAIGDPLTHLVRNAIDHGLETPEQRRALRKPECGTLHLRAFHQSGKVRIEIRDDGRGIDTAKVKLKALEKGLITVEQARDMGDGEAAKLIFLPGFSTADQVSDVSGRGVGMDVVRTNIEKLSGSVEIETELGKGSTIVVTLPLTLAIIPSLIVYCGKNRFAIPQVNIAELVRIRAAEVKQKIDTIHGCSVLRLRGDLLPLVDLRKAFGLKVDEERNSVSLATNVIVVESGHLKYGLVVDALSDSEEIVVKPLDRHLTKSRCLNGATILGDGRVALILDVAGIAAHEQLRVVTDPRDAEQGTHGERSNNNIEPQTLLLFHNHPQEKFAIPMSLVARIERISAEEVVEIGGREVLRYRGNSLPLLSLENLIKAKPRVDAHRLFVIVFSVRGKEVGLLAPELEDIRTLTIDPDSVTLNEPGVLGSFVHNDATVRLLDLFALTERIYPDIMITKPIGQAKSVEPMTILLAEDSNFFRKQVREYFKKMGYRTVDYPDGLAAWTALNTGQESVNIVVTDIEMPEMDGLTLCRSIKADPALKSLPVIALTSLAAEEDIRKGQLMGIDEYQIKMDREKLLEAVQRLSLGAPVGKGRTEAGKVKGVC